MPKKGAVLETHHVHTKANFITQIKFLQYILSGFKTPASADIKEARVGSISVSAVAGHLKLSQNILQELQVLQLGRLKLS